ncbi:hypothetical protein Lser_V15G17389 [Lactuca serriola]
MGNMKTIHSFFKINVDNEESHDKNQEIKRHKSSTSEPQPQEHENQQENDRNEATQSNPNEVVQVDLKQLERDPAKRKQIACHDYDAFNVTRFDNWKKVNDGKNCALLKHIGCSQHRNVVAFAENLMSQEAHIENIIMKQNEEQILKNRLRLKASIDTVPSYNDEVANVILEKAPYNSKYTSGEIQKEIHKGIIRERFLDLVHVRDTLSLTLKTNMWRQLLHNQFDVSKICGQCYDGANYNYPCKHHDELQKAKATEIEQLLELGEIESGKGLNQVKTLRRAGDTCWGSHFRSGIIDDLSTTYSQRRDADATYGFLKSFKFVFILHLIKEVMGKTDVLSQALQKKSQDILNAMELVSAVKLLSLSSTLVSKEHPKVIKVDQICRLVEKYYPEDFTEQERIQLRYQLEIFNIDITKNPKLSGVSTIADFCKGLVETQKRETYYLLDRLVRLILTLPASTATTERGFSAMKIFKNRRRNTMLDGFLANTLVVYIEREIAENIDSKSVIEEFKDLKSRRAEL